MTAIVNEYGDKLSGKIIVNITTPFNATFDGLAIAPDTSAAEEVAKAAPAGAKVVNAFSTNLAGTLVAGQVAGHPLDVCIAGDDAQAKAVMAQLVDAGGLRALDIEPLQRARQLEAMHFLNVMLKSKLDKPWMSAIKVLT